ncbi:MAG: hypothetical protein ACKO6B_15655 [Planctomycetia bacterium]
MFPSARSAAGIGLRGLLAFVACLQGAWPSRVAADFDAPITATWNGIGLRDWAGRVSQTTGVPVLVDRRLDPDTPIRLACRDEPLLDVVDRGAAVAGGEVAALRSSLCIVPAGRAAVLVRAEAARDARLAKLPPRQRSALAAKQRLTWPAGATPRDLLSTAAAEAGVVVEGFDTVPHDHLAASALPEMTLAERLDLLLAPLDLRIDWQTPTGGRATAAPSGTIIAIDAGLPASTGTRPPDAKPTRRRTPATSKPAAQESTFSMQVAAPLEELLTTIAPRLGLTLALDRESLERSGIAPAEIVRATVKDASRDELLDAILAPLGLTWSITGDTLRVQAPAR